MTEKELPTYLTEGTGHVDVTLSRPATIAGATASTLRMREPTTGDMEAFQNAKGSDSTREIMSFASLCEIAPEDVRKLPFRDYKRLQEAFGLFTD